MIEDRFLVHHRRTVRDQASGSGAAQRARRQCAPWMLRSELPGYEIWRGHEKGGDTRAVPMGDVHRLVIRRQGYSPHAEPAGADLFGLLAAIAAGTPLAAPAEGGRDLQALPGLIVAGWISGFESGGD
jgi:hypothetical protein